MAGRTLFLACLLCALCAIVPAQSFSAAETALRNAITNPSIKAIVLKENIILTADLPVIPDNKVLTVTGKLNGGNGKVTVDGAKKFTIFQSSGNAPVTLTLTNLRITGAKATFPAVTLSILGTKLTATNVDFVNNPQGLSLSSVNAVISKCTFTGHKLGAIDVASEEGDPDIVKITGCTFTSNQAEFGGAGVNGGKYTTLDISSSKFIKNTVNYRGGAIRIRESATATVKSSVFDSNTAKEQGGAITCFNGGLTISGCTFKNNVAKTGPGGAIRVGSADGFGALATVSSSTFTGNKATSGGAFVMDTTSDETDLYFCKSTFSGNSPNNGFIIGFNNTIFTKGGAPITGVTTDVGATLTYSTDPKCK